MKAFSFRLETLLHLREMAKDKAIAEYGLAIARREEAQKVLQERKRQMEDLREEIGRRRSTGFSGSEQNSYNRSIERSKEAIIDCNSNFEEAKKIAEAKRELYLNADSQFKSLLKLKEKQRDRHIEFETKKEEMQLEDIISSRFVFNQSTSH
ncbi:MAG: flagellar export protein FliJ [Opitutae bacterium]